MGMNPRLLRPTASGFDPRRISGLFQWYDGSDRATMFDATTGGAAVANDGTVARWEDKSGNGYHLTQGTAGNRPTLRAAIRNGLSVLEYDGANSNLVSASITNGLDALSVFTVFYADSLGGGNEGRLWGNAAGLGLGGTRHFRTQSGPTLAAAFGSNDARVTTASYSLATFMRAHAFWNGGNNRATDFEFLYNGVVTAPGTTGTMTVASAAASATSVGNSVAGTRAWDGYIAEVLVYTRLLSVAERTAVDNWLARKWGF